MSDSVPWDSNRVYFHADDASASVASVGNVNYPQLSGHWFRVRSGPERAK